MNRNPPNRVRPHASRRGRGGWQKQRREGERNRSERGSDSGSGTAPDSVPRGTCTTMCPARELKEREAQNRLHCFEMLAGTERDRLPKADVSRTVKEYSRPAAGKDSTRPSDLRPPAVLLKTVNFLIDDIAASPSLQQWTEVYGFVFDRLRSVRQDMIIQRVSGPDCVAVLERTVRFHVYASYRLCGAPLRHYDPHINDTHLQESLSWLLECYSHGQHPNQEEFYALNLLYNLGSSFAMQHVLELPERVRSSPSVRLALAISRAYLERNPVRVLRLARQLTFLQGCALHRHLLACRTELLLLYSHGHSSRNCRFPLDRLSLVLSLDEPLTTQLCQAHGVQVNGDWVAFSKTGFAETPSGDFQCRQTHKLLDSKQKDLSVSSIIHGCV
ncbi:SAC3 domain-containing protein 1 [Chanos chanos]|uniref:SAC3 domain-containing protein 1 n=1 Tax=Chanos chanos TaxID=29144 RepID=A0A6J2W9V5_CHACN|nr:SAC3 domain-containing protein 1 [Chanos chanos]